MSTIQKHCRDGREEAALFEAHDVMVPSIHVGPDDTRPLFSGIDIRLEKGDIVDLVGPSGVGKTTLLQALARLHPYASGSFELHGVSHSEFTGSHWRTHVALLPQTAAFMEGTVGDNLLTPYSMDERKGWAKPSQENLRDMLDSAGLGDIELSRNIHRLSVGEMARVALCRTLLTEPDILLIDEVDAALDSESMKRISRLVAGYVSGGERACIRIRHREQDEYATRRLRLADGVIHEEML